MLHIEDHGRDNWLEIAPHERETLSGRIVFTGHHARIAIGPACLDTGLHIEAGDRAAITIGRNNHLGALFIHAAANTTVELGDDLGLNGPVRLLLHEPGRLTIGNGCLIAADVDISISDMHPIFDLGTGARINPPADIAIAERVWIGQRSLILKGATIGHDTVIGAAAVVSGTIPPHCIAAGNPARITRTGVSWRMDLPPSPSPAGGRRPG